MTNTVCHSHLWNKILNTQIHWSTPTHNTSQWGKDCGHRAPLLRSISWLTVITDWLWGDCIPSSRNLLLPRGLCVCVCVCVYDGGLSQLTRLLGSEEGSGGGGFDHHNTQKCTHHPGSKRCKQRARNHTAWGRWLFPPDLYWSATIPTLSPSLPPSPFLTALLPLLLFFFFLEADLSWVKQKR